MNMCAECRHVPSTFGKQKIKHEPKKQVVAEYFCDNILSLPELNYGEFASSDIRMQPNYRVHNSITISISRFVEQKYTC